MQAQIEDTQAEIVRLTNLPSRTPSQELELQALQGRIVTLRQTYATMLGFSSNSGANLLTVVDPASPPASPASPRVLLNTLLAALVGLLLALGFVFVLEHLDDTVKSADGRGGGGRPADAGDHRQDAGGKGQSEIYRLATHPLPALARGGGVSDPAHQRGVRRRGRAGPDAPRHELHPGRGQDHDRREPRGRLRPGRSPDDPAGRGLPQAGRPPDLRPAQRPRAVQPAALGRDRRSTMSPRPPSRRTCG